MLPTSSSQLPPPSQQQQQQQQQVEIPLTVASIPGGDKTARVWENGPTFYVLFTVYYHTLKPDKVGDVMSLIDHYQHSVEGGLDKMQEDMTAKYTKSPQNVYRNLAMKLMHLVGAPTKPTPTQVLRYAEKLTNERNKEEWRLKNQNHYNQQQELQKQRERKQKEAELARIDAELKLHEPGPLVKTFHQKKIVRRYMDLAIQKSDRSFGQSYVSILENDRERVESIMHDAIDQYLRKMLQRLVRGSKYRRRSLEKNPLSGMTILLPATTTATTATTATSATSATSATPATPVTPNDAASCSKSGMLEENTKEKQRRLRDEFGPVVASFDQEEIIQAWRKQRKRRDDTFLAEGEKTLDEQSMQLLKATVCSDTMSSRYQAMLQGNSSATANNISRSIGIDALQRLVSEERRDRYSTQIRQRPSSLVSGGGGSSSSGSSGGGGTKRKRGEEEGEDDAVNEGEASLQQQKIRLTFSQRAIEFCYDSEAVVDRVKRRYR